MQRRLVKFSGFALLAASLLLIGTFAWRTYSGLYNCEFGSGAVPVQGCGYFLQLPFYQWSGASMLLSGLSSAAVGSLLVILSRRTKARELDRVPS
jgi:hypothetical protein